MMIGLIVACALGLLALLLTLRLGLLQLAPAGKRRPPLRHVPTRRLLPVSSLFATSIAASRGALLLLEQRVATLRRAHGDTGAVYAVAVAPRAVLPVPVSEFLDRNRELVLSLVSALILGVAAGLIVFALS
jgi:hypothetical protein